MKKTVLLLTFLLAFFSAVRAQTITSFSMQSGGCLFANTQITISSAASNLSTRTYWGDGKDTIINLHPQQTTTWSWYKYAAPGTYPIRLILLNNGIPIDSQSVLYTVSCNYVVLETYADNNTNCTKDTNEKHITEVIAVEVDSAGSIIDTVYLLGSMEYKITVGTTYKFRELNVPLGTNLTCPSNGIITITPTGTGFNGFVQFGHKCVNSSLFDLSVITNARFRPVNDSRFFIHAQFKGCGSQTGTITLNLSNKYKYKSATPSPASVSGQAITWIINFSNISNSHTIQLIADTATTVSPDDTVCNTVIITPLTGDINTSNNTVTPCDPVRASWDPNDKRVLPAGDIMPGTKLTYTINFENLGNDTAFNISIFDTLTAAVDRSSFRILASSHDVSYAFIDGPTGQQIIRFDFKDIYLADKNSPTYNKGFVQFSVDARKGLTPLTIIRNKASIYFDINPPIVTNFAENRIAPVSVEKLDTISEFLVYPNPVSDILTIQMNNGGYEILRLLNNMGQVVAQQSISDNTTTINMGQLPTGMYYLQLIGKDNTITQKIEKH